MSRIQQSTPQLSIQAELDEQFDALRQRRKALADAVSRVRASAENVVKKQQAVADAKAKLNARKQELVDLGLRPRQAQAMIREAQEQAAAKAAGNTNAETSNAESASDPNSDAPDRPATEAPGLEPSDASSNRER